MSESEKCYCHTCGYTWLRGQSGAHECTTHLLRLVAQLEASQTKRPVSVEAEEMLHTKIPVLDHGYVMLIDYSGVQETIPQRARISYNPESTRRVNTDKKLTRQLYGERHTAPFEQCDITVAMSTPMPITAQIATHRTAKRGQESARYSVIQNRQYLPGLDRFCLQSKNNKQGSGAPLDPFMAESIRNEMEQRANDAYDFYQRMIDAGMTREVARFALPQSMYTTFYWRMDSRNLMHFLSLRQDPHAQWEVRQYANALADILRKWMPEVWRAYEDYTLQAVTFSRMEIEALRQHLDATDTDVRSLVLSADGLTTREQRGFAAKLRGPE